MGILLASAYGLGAAAPYRDLPQATVVSARAQDVCSLLVATLLLVRSRSLDRRQAVVRIGLFAYVAYSYLIYATGIPMNRVFLVYVALVAVSGGAIVSGLTHLVEVDWPVAPRGLEQGTGWFLVAVSCLFTALWLSALLPFALGGPSPTTRGPGGAPYPVFVLDLSIVLPCLAAIGAMLLRQRWRGRPLAIVALVKIITLFTALWAGVAAGFLQRHHVSLGADAAPSLVMLAGCCWLLRRWWLVTASTG